MRNKETKQNKKQYVKFIKTDISLASVDYEREYHRLIGEITIAHNEREEAKGSVIFMSKIIAEKDRKIAELEKEREDNYWRNYDRR